MLIIKKASAMKKEFFNFVEELKYVTDEFEDNYYTLDYISTNKDKNVSDNYLVVLKNNKIIDIICNDNFLKSLQFHLFVFISNMIRRSFLKP